jgi:uncharacterized protein (TIGR03435 family)
MILGIKPSRTKLLLALCVILAIPAPAQILRATGPRPTFDVATIKPSRAGEDHKVVMATRDGYFTADHFSLRDLVKFAYQINLDDQLTGGPAWVDQQYFDVEGKAAQSEVESMRRQGVAWSINQFDFMVQSLLEDRFALKVSTRTEQLPAYALVIAKGGPKLKQVAVSQEMAMSVQPPPPPPPGPPPSQTPPAPGASAPPANLPGVRQTGPNQLTANGARIAWLADWLSHQAEVGNRAVIDQTGLTGNYDFVLNGVTLQPPAPGAPPADDLTVSIFTALQQQLGLRLTPTKAPAEVLVIDHADAPSPN